MTMNGQIHAPASFFPVIGCRYPLDKRPDWLQCSSEPCGGERTFAPDENRTLIPRSSISSSSHYKDCPVEQKTVLCDAVLINPMVFNY
jgi:hypothetical protein